MPPNRKYMTIKRKAKKELDAAKSMNEKENKYTAVVKAVNHIQKDRSAYK
ncbi:4574_t:CDS:2, partial [Entrophospora sp. SA101]